MSLLRRRHVQFAWFIILTLLVGGGRAPATSGGSAYSIVGIGDIWYFPNTRSVGMGYASLAAPSPYFINTVSPAAWTTIDRAMAEGSVLWAGVRSTDGTNSRFLSNADFNGGLLAIPISKDHGIVVVAGFTPYSRVNYDTYTRGSHTGSQDTVQYSLHHVGIDGLGRGRLGLSYRPFGDLHLGASFDYVFGSIQRTVELIPLSQNFKESTARETSRFNGATATFGVVFSGFGALAEELAPLSIGGVITTRANLHASRKTTYTYSALLDTSGDVEGRAGIPVAYGVGASYRIADRLLVAADYYAQPWSQSEIHGATPDGVRNSYRLAAGMELTPSTQVAASWFQRAAYRLGYSFNATYVELNGQPINEWVVTAGMDFPFSGLTRMAFALEYGERGTTKANLIQDRILRLSVSLSIGEQWFVRPEEE